MTTDESSSNGTGTGTGTGTEGVADVPAPDPGGMGPPLNEPPGCVDGPEPLAEVSLEERPVEPTLDQIHEATVGWFDADEYRDLAVSYGDEINPAWTQVLRGTGEDFVAEVPPFERLNPWVGGAAADFDDDGRQELLHNQDVAYLEPDGSLHILVEISPGATTVDDVNDDGRPDLISNLSETMLIRLGVGDGTFAEPIETPFEKARSVSTILGDFDGDGTVDVVVVGSQSGPGMPGDASFQLLRGVGDGSFIADPVVPLPPTGVEGATADFDCDGKHELVLSRLADDTVEIWSLTGDMWAPSVTLDVSAPARPLGAEVNGDGAYDLVVAGDGPLATTLWVYPGDGAGGFQAPVEVWASGDRDLWISTITAGDPYGLGVQSLIVTFDNVALSLFVPPG